MFQNCKKCYGILPASVLSRINQNLLSVSQGGSAWKQTSYLLQARHEAVGRRTLLTSGQQRLSPEQELAVRSTVCYHQGFHREGTFPESLPVLLSQTINDPKNSGMTIKDKDYLYTLRNKVCPRHPSSECGLPHLSRCRRGIFITRPEKRYFSSSSNLSHPAREENVMNVFDRKTKRKQRDRAALAKDVEVYDYIKDEVINQRISQGSYRILLASYLASFSRVCLNNGSKRTNEILQSHDSGLFHNKYFWCVCPIL